MSPGWGRVRPEGVVVDDLDLRGSRGAFEGHRVLGVHEEDRVDGAAGQVARLDEGQLSAIEGQEGA